MPNLRADKRYPISVLGRYRVGRGVPRDVTVLDLSESGARFFDKFGSLRSGQIMTLRMGPVGPIVATVAWSTGQVVGVQFDSALYGPVFEHIRDQVNDGGNTTTAAVGY